MAEEIAMLVGTHGIEPGYVGAGGRLVGRAAHAHPEYPVVVIALLDLDHHGYHRILGSSARKAQRVGVVEELAQGQIALGALEPASSEQIAGAELGPGEDDVIGGKEVATEEDGADPDLRPEAHLQITSIWSPWRIVLASTPA